MTLTASHDQALLDKAEAGITAYLQAERKAGRLAESYYDAAIGQTLPNLRKWLLADELDAISPHLRDGLRHAIQEELWPELTNAFSRQVAFGTGGIREKMGATRDVIRRLKEEGIHAPIIKGPNTINDVVYLLTSAAVAQFGLQRDPPLTRIVIGFDSRVRGSDFARLIATLFLAYDYTVYLFDEACMYPSVTYAVPTLRADMGVFISASHNDLRYNGYKLSCPNGSQFDPDERQELYADFISKVSFQDNKTMPLQAAPKDRLWFLGGTPSSPRRSITEGEHAGLPLADPLPHAKERYAGREDRIIDLHSMHAEHVRRFVLRPDLLREARRPLLIAYSAFNGSGRKAVPRLLSDVGFQKVRRIMKLDPLDGTFPAFCSDPGKEQQPDPGDWRAADIAVEAFKEEYPDEWDALDLIIGTDPDADRCGVVVKIPEHQRPAYTHPGTGQLRDYALLSADEVWSLILWYRLNHEVEVFGRIRDVEKKFIALSHTTTDLLTRIARRFDLGVLKTWVGFAQLAAGTRTVWDLRLGRDTVGLTEGGRLPVYAEGRRRPEDQLCNRTIHSWESMDDHNRSMNVAALEQSNGFSILGDVPPDERSLGRNGHVRDKDGTFAALLIAELAQYAKEQNANLLDLLDEKIYTDPGIGLYITHYEPDPLDGEYEGLAGYSKKREILSRAEELLKRCQSNRHTGRHGHSCSSENPARIKIGGLEVTGAVIYPTGKYDTINWPGFPDEGLRFYFDDECRSHLTLRPSGTSNALRFHVQLFGGHPSRKDVIGKKAELRGIAARIVDDFRTKVGALRS